jgi:cytochrome b561
VFALVLVRLWWRFAHPPPEVPMPALQARVANFVHVLIYALLIVNGIAGSVGWLLSGDPIVFFGMQVAPARAASPALAHLCVVVGMTTARALVVVIALHVIAVVKHEWLDRDRILQRMLPGPSILLPLQPKAIVQRLRERRQRQRELRASNDASPNGD